MPRDQRDPQLLGEAILGMREWHRASSRPHETLSGLVDAFPSVLRVPPFDATHQGPIEKYGDPRAK